MEAQHRSALSVLSAYPLYTSSEKHTVNVLVRITAPEAKNDVGKAPVCVSAVLDRSGSMAGKKLTLTKSTGKFLIEQLKSTDTFGLVAFDSQVQEVFGQKSVSPDAKAAMAQRVDAINANSCTNLSGGLLKGIEQIQTAAEPDAPVRSVFLFTDGQANEGITNIAQLRSTLHQVLDHPRPLSIHTFGFGSDHSTEFLKAIAETANGNYYFIETEENIPEAFAHALGMLMSVTAQNVEVTALPMAADSSVTLINPGYKTQKDAEENSTKVSVGDMCDGQHKELLFRVEVPKAMEEGPQALLDVRLKMFDVEAAAFVDRSFCLSLQRPKAAPGNQVAEPSVVALKLRLETADVMEKAMEKAASNRVEEARKLLTDQVELLTSELHAAKRASDDTPDGKHSLSTFIEGMIKDLKELLASYQSYSHYRSRGHGVTQAYHGSYTRYAHTNVMCSLSSGTRAQERLVRAANRQVNGRPEDSAGAALTQIPEPASAPAPAPAPAPGMFAALMQRVGLGSSKSSTATDA